MKAYFAIFGASILAAVACGARTGLDVPLPPRHDAGPDVEDAGPDVEDAPPDVPPDVEDAPPDVPVINDCADAGTTYIYLITEENFLYSFYPPDNGFKQIGLISCNDPGNGTPFSMAVDRQGTAYVLFNSGNLFHVSTATAACKPTKFVKNQGGFNSLFGMGFSANPNDPGETLFVASDGNGMVQERLATIDPTTFKLSVVGPFSKMIGNAELTGTGDAKLYGFGINIPLIHLAQIDKLTANILDDKLIQLPDGNKMVTAWAFAFWGGDFYFFSSVSNGSSTVSRYHPGGSLNTTLITKLNKTIVGAGVSTCAPQQ